MFSKFRYAKLVKKKEGVNVLQVIQYIFFFFPGSLLYFEIFRWIINGLLIRVQKIPSLIFSLGGFRECLAYLSHTDGILSKLYWIMVKASYGTIFIGVSGYIGKCD